MQKIPNSKLLNSRFAGQSDTIIKQFQRMGFLFWVLFAAVLVQISIMLFVPEFEMRFQLGDRAWARTEALKDWLAADGAGAMLKVLFYYNQPGDYILFLPAYSVLGAVGVVLQNLLLWVLGLFYLHKIGATYFSEPVARISLISYLFLPATLYHPHTLASEAICDPLLIISTFYAIRLFLEQKNRIKNAVFFGGISAILMFVRQIYLLYPVLICGLFLVFYWKNKTIDKKEMWLTISIIIAVGYSLTLAWSSAVSLAHGRYEAKETFQGLRSNLYIRADRMGKTADLDLPQSVVSDKRMGLFEFTRFSLQHPSAFVRIGLSDVINLIGNTGVNMVYGRFLGLFSLKEKTDKDVFKWANARDQGGLLAIVKLIAKTSPLALVMNVLFVSVWAVFLLVCAFGVWRAWSSPMVQNALLSLFGATVIYVMLFTFVSGGPRWDHRAPIEFLLCLGFALGFAALRQMWWKKSRSSV